MFSLEPIRPTQILKHPDGPRYVTNKVNGYVQPQRKVSASSTPAPSPPTPSVPAPALAASRRKLRVENKPMADATQSEESLLQPSRQSTEEPNETFAEEKVANDDDTEVVGSSDVPTLTDPVQHPSHNNRGGFGRSMDHRGGPSRRGGSTFHQRNYNSNVQRTNSFGGRYDYNRGRGGRFMGNQQRSGDASMDHDIQPVNRPDTAHGKVNTNG